MCVKTAPDLIEVLRVYLNLNHDDDGDFCVKITPFVEYGNNEIKTELLDAIAHAVNDAKPHY